MLYRTTFHGVIASEQLNFGERDVVTGVLDTGNEDRGMYQHRELQGSCRREH